MSSAQLAALTRRRSDKVGIIVNNSEIGLDNAEVPVLGPSIKL